MDMSHADCNDCNGRCEHRLEQIHLCGLVFFGTELLFFYKYIKATQKEYHNFGCSLKKDTSYIYI